MGLHARALTTTLAAAATVAVLGTMVGTAGPAAAQTFDGTEGGEKLTGTSSSDTMYGRGGNDEIDGRGGGDRIYGGEGDDLVYSRKNVQQAQVWGENGNDQVIGWRFDRISGGDGDDVLSFWEQRRAGVADCGAGFDTLRVTRGTPLVISVRGCERIRTVPGGAARFAR